MMEAERPRNHESERELARADALKKFDELRADMIQDAREELARGEIKTLREHEPDPGEIAAAKRCVENLMRSGEYPKVTVNRKKLQEILKHGIIEKPTRYQPSLKLIVGTIGREPLLHPDEDRVVLEIRADANDVEPRFSGEANTFDGVVRIKGPVIPPEKLRVVESERDVPEAAE